jgi:hypothetical protein
VALAPLELSGRELMVQASLARLLNGGRGAICEIVNHQGHQGTPRKYLKPKAFVILGALGGSGFHRLHHETARSV